LQELTEVLTEEDVISLLAWYNYKSTLQRAGFILEELLGDNVFAKIIMEKLNTISYYSILLSPKMNQKPGSADNRWKVDVNLKLESDL
jgi:predicted transcriptional regulator of viral defense system